MKQHIMRGKYIKSLNLFIALSALTVSTHSFAQIRTSKSATYDYETGQGILTLESYVTGEKVKKPFVKATDLVMVLDVSNSMCPYNSGTQSNETVGRMVYLFGGDQIGYLHKGTSETDNNTTTHDYKTIFKLDRTSYLRYTIQLNGTGTMYNLAYFENGKSYGGTRWSGSTGWYYGSNTNLTQSGTRWKPYTANSEDDKIYTDVKLDILEKACRELINVIYDNPATDATTGHRISVITWADNNDGTNSIHYVNRPLTEVSSNRDVLISDVTFLETGPNTYACRGFEKAITNLGINPSNITHLSRNTIVLFFTDGEPNNKFADIVNDAKTLKDAGAKVFSVGLVADDKKTAAVWNTQRYPDTDMTIKTYLEYVSSLYPNATGSKRGTGDQAKSTITPGDKNPDGVQYYIWSQDGENLADAFIEIGSTVTGGADITDMNASDDVYLKDKINNDYCELPAGTVASDIKTFTAACNGKSGDELTFGDKESVNLTVTVDVEATPQSVSVEGFDYSDNWCGPDPEAAGGYHGKKLIIEIPFKMKVPGSGTVEVVNTNAPGSSLYRGDEAIDGAVFTSPTISFTEITIQKTGLKAGESALYIVMKGGVEIARIILTGNTSGTMVSNKLRLLEPVDPDEYSVVETGWDYTYTTLPQERIGNVFKFISSKNTEIKNTAEGIKVNDFRDNGTLSGGLDPYSGNAL